MTGRGLHVHPNAKVVGGHDFVGADYAPWTGNLPEPDPDPEFVRIAKPVRDLVTFRYLNFVEPWPLSGPFDAIFCRNVAIYMAEDMQARVWAGLESVLGPDGVLFIGHSERLGPEFRDRLELCDKTTFRRVGSARALSDCRTD